MNESYFTNSYTLLVSAEKSNTVVSFFEIPQQAPLEGPGEGENQQMQPSLELIQRPSGGGTTGGGY